MNRDALRVSLAALAASLLLACSAQTADEHVAKARELLAAGKSNDAGIELRNALQQNDNHLEARRLLGRVFMQQGDTAGATVEFRKALQLSEPGATRDDAVIQLAQALMASGQWRPVINEFGMTDLKKPAQRAELKTMVAAAYGLAGESELALAALEEALQQGPDYAPARMLRARGLASQGRGKEALAENQSVLDADAKNTDAWVLKGELHTLQGDAAAALTAWKRALELDPRHLGALVAQVRHAMSSGKPEEVAPPLAALVKAYPQHPQTLEVRAKVSMTRQQWAAAREDTSLLLRMAPSDPRILTLAGDAEWRAGSTTTAQAHLQKALSLAPEDVPARTLLALTQVRGGEPALALQTLDRLLKSKAASAEALGVAGEAHLLMGAGAAAESAFARAAAASPKDPRWPPAQAMAGLARGDSARSLAKLQALARTDPTGMGAKALIKAHMQRGETPAAMKALAALEARLSKPDPMLVLVRGQLHQQAGDAAQARASFEEALRLSPSYLSAAEALARLDLAGGKGEAAALRLRALAKQQPNDPAVQLALARVLARASAPGAEVQAALETAVSVAPQDPEPALTLTAYLLQRNRAAEALDVARKAQATIPNDDTLLEALAQAQLESGETQQAISSYRKLVAARQQSPLMLTALARAQLAAGDASAAGQVLREALAKTPGFVPALSAQVDLALAAKQWPQALALAREQQKRAPSAVEGWAWEARTLAAQGQWAEAADAWSRALAKAPTTANAVQLQRALRRAQRVPDADRTAAQWLAQHPADWEMRVALGDLTLASGDAAAAEGHYRAVLAALPNHAIALNNLASLMAGQGKKGAVELAERANRLDPNRPAFMDTLAQALATEDQLGKAVDLQKQAVERYPRLPYLRVTLARLALKNGDKSLAREQLKLAQRSPASQDMAGELAALAKQAE